MQRTVITPLHPQVSTKCSGDLRLPAGVLHAAAPHDLHHEASKAACGDAGTNSRAQHPGLQAVAAVWPEQPCVRELARLCEGAVLQPSGCLLLHLGCGIVSRFFTWLVDFVSCFLAWPVDFVSYFFAWLVDFVSCFFAWPVDFVSCFFAWLVDFVSCLFTWLVDL